MEIGRLNAIMVVSLMIGGTGAALLAPDGARSATDDTADHVTAMFRISPEETRGIVRSAAQSCLRALLPDARRDDASRRHDADAGAAPPWPGLTPPVRLAIRIGNTDDQFSLPDPRAR